MTRTRNFNSYCKRLNTTSNNNEKIQILSELQGKY